MLTSVKRLAKLLFRCQIFASGHLLREYLPKRFCLIFSIMTLTSSIRTLTSSLIVFRPECTQRNLNLQGSSYHTYKHSAYCKVDQNTNISHWGDILLMKNLRSLSKNSKKKLKILDNKFSASFPTSISGEDDRRQKSGIGVIIMLFF
jgi:hypothetical protein